MKTAIIVAMGKELQLLLPIIENHAVTTVNGKEFHTGNIAGREVVAMQCGIGKVNAAVGTLTMIDIFHPSLVINTGVAGGTGAGNDAPGILDVVLASGVAYHDVWCGPGTEPGEASGCPRIFPSPLPPETAGRLGAHSGLIASGDIFVSRRSEVDHILELYPDAAAVDMESGAIAQVCHIKSVPYVCMRVISDTPGAADNIAQYGNFWSDAPEATFTALKKLLKMI